VNSVQFPDFTREEPYYVIGVGKPDKGLDDVGFYILYREQNAVLPLFSSREKAEEYIKTILRHPGAYMDVMLEGSGIEQPGASEYLQNDQYFIVPVDAEGFAMARSNIDGDAVVLDMGRGENRVVRVGR
jgi:hypothetical protein